MRHIVSIKELTNSRQWNNELVINYINHWRSLVLKCEGHLSKSLTVEMCAQEKDWDIFYAFRVNKGKHSKNWQ